MRSIKKKNPIRAPPAMNESAKEEELSPSRGGGGGKQKGKKAEFVMGKRKKKHRWHLSIREW